MDKIKRLLRLCVKHFPSSRGNPTLIELVRGNGKRIAFIEISGNYLSFIPDSKYFLGLTFKNREIFISNLTHLKKEIEENLILDISKLGEDDFEYFLEADLEDKFSGVIFKNEIFKTPSMIFQDNPSPVKTKKEFELLID